RAPVQSFPTKAGVMGTEATTGLPLPAAIVDLQKKRPARPRRVLGLHDEKSAENSTSPRRVARGQAEIHDRAIVRILRRDGEEHFPRDLLSHGRRFAECPALRGA